ncbi:MAG: hypothetical protein LBD13_03095 [Spirochaetaceae bacterium]|nr:hypothetical protein [Spirochaetaceae bacterium]
MSELTDYQNALAQAINARQRWLEKTEVAKLKEKLRAFQTAYNSLYALFLRKGLIKEDPYKGDAKAGEMRIPDSSPFSETESGEQISIRLSQFDTQLDFLVNFYNFNMEFLTLDRIKLILGLIKYIDWLHLATNTESPMTMAAGSLIARLRGGGSDPVASNVLNGVLVTLTKLTTAIMSDLKVFTSFNREAYKLELRTAMEGKMPADKAPSVPEIKAAFAAANGGRHFYAELAEELLKEDYSPEGPGLREKILKSLGIAKEEAKPAKQEVSLKPLLIEGIQAIGSVAATLNQIGGKFDENETILENQKVSFWGKVRRVVGQMLNKEPEPVIYEIEFAAEGNQRAPGKERVNFNRLREDMERKAKNLAIAGARGNLPKLEAMPEEQLSAFLERAIKEIRTLHRILGGLDDFFKNTAGKEERSKVKGIKPELATIKNAFLKANEKFLEYSTAKEEEDQFKRLGIDTVG